MFTLIKIVPSGEAGGQGASTGLLGHFRYNTFCLSCLLIPNQSLKFWHRDILERRDENEEKVVVVMPGWVRDLKGVNGQSMSRELLNAASIGAASEPTRLTSRPDLSAQREDSGPPNAGRAHTHRLSTYGGQFGDPYVQNEGFLRTNRPIPERQVVAQNTGRAHTYGLGTYGGQFDNPYVQTEEFRVPREQFGMPPVGGEGSRGQFVMPPMGGEEARRSEAFLRQQFGVLPAGRGLAQGRPMHEAQTLQYNHYGTPPYGYEGEHSEQQRSRGQRAPRNAHEGGHGSLSIPAARQQASGAHQHGLPPPEGQRNSSARPAASASRNSSHPEKRSGARPQGPPPRESQRNLRAPLVAPASRNSSNPEHESPVAESSTSTSDQTGNPSPDITGATKQNAIVIKQESDEEEENEEEKEKRNQRKEFVKRDRMARAEREKKRKRGE